MFEPIARDSLVDNLVARLTADILTGRYEPGVLLPPERELAGDYRVTRTSLKHAFVRLAQLGLVETRHGVGTRIRDYERLGGPELLPLLVQAGSPDWIEEIFAARREIGALITREAARRATPAHHTRLLELLTEVRTASSTDQAQLADCEVHRVLADASGNRVYRLLSNTLLDAYLPVRQLLSGPFEDPAAAAQRLEPVIAAVRAGDAARAHEKACEYMDATRLLMRGLQP